MDSEQVLRGGTTIVGAANGLSLTVESGEIQEESYRADGGDNPLQRTFAFSVSIMNGQKRSMWVYTYMGAEIRVINVSNLP